MGKEQQEVEEDWQEEEVGEVHSKQHSNATQTSTLPPAVSQQFASSKLAVRK